MNDWLPCQEHWDINRVFLLGKSATERRLVFDRCCAGPRILQVNQLEIHLLHYTLKNERYLVYYFSYGIDLVFDWLQLFYYNELSNDIFTRKTVQLYLIGQPFAQITFNKLTILNQLNSTLIFHNCQEGLYPLKRSADIEAKESICHLIWFWNSYHSEFNNNIFIHLK